MLPIAAVALCVAAAWVVLSRASVLADRLGLIDRPDGQRKIHARPTPRIGGVALMAALAVLALVSCAIGGAPDRLVVSGFLLVLFHFALGAVDDRCGLRASSRLLLSIAACGAMLAFNDELVIRTIEIGGWSFALPPVTAFILTVLGVVFFIFSVNLMDGRNGILGANALWWLVLLEVTTGIMPIWVFTGLIGSLLLFLRLNLRGQLFAGDAGAYVVGSGAALFALTLHGRHPHALAFDQAMVVFLLPMLDAARVLIRRTWLHMAPFKADDTHLHHVLWRRAGDRLAERLYVGAIVVPSTFAMLVPGLAAAILAAAAGFFFLLVYWPVERAGALDDTRMGRSMPRQRVLVPVSNPPQRRHRHGD